MHVSPKSDNQSHSHGPPTGCLPGSDFDVDEFKMTKELLNKVMALDDVEQDILFDSSRYPAGENASLYMTPLLSPPRNYMHNRKHRKK